VTLIEDALPVGRRLGAAADLGPDLLGELDRQRLAALIARGPGARGSVGVGRGGAEALILRRAVAPGQVEGLAEGMAQMDEDAALLAVFVWLLRDVDEHVGAAEHRRTGLIQLLQHPGGRRTLDAAGHMGAA